MAYSGAASCGYPKLNDLKWPPLFTGLLEAKSWTKLNAWLHVSYYLPTNINVYLMQFRGREVLIHTFKFPNVAEAQVASETSFKVAVLGYWPDPHTTMRY